jgi:hypothetical protein
MGKIGYALREEFRGTVVQRVDEDDPGNEVNLFQGGVLNIGDKDLNVAEALEEGDGVIVVEDLDPRVSTALDGYPALERVPVDGRQAIAGGYADRSATDLRAELGERGIVGAGSLSKADAVAALEAHVGELLNAHPGGGTPAAEAETSEPDPPAETPAEGEGDTTEPAGDGQEG